MEKYIVYRYSKPAEGPALWSFGDTVCEFTGGRLSLDRDLAKRKLLFAVATRGRYQICFVKTPEGEIIHYSFVIPYCAKFSFMERGDVQIGPCWTKPEYRGQGMFGKVLEYIAQKTLESNPQAKLYVLVRRANVASTKGVQKTNYIAVGECTKTKYLKHYKKVDWYQ